MRAAIFILLLTSVASCGLLENRKDQSASVIPGKIVFSADDESGTSQIYTMNTDGSDVKKLTNFPAEGGAFDPTWGPDGNRIAFVNFTGATTLGPYLYVMDADGTNMRPLKRRQSESLAALVGSAPAWSPDGSRIAYQVCTNCELGGSNFEIVVVEAAGEVYDSHQIHDITDHPASDTHPTWGPTGSRITFTSDRDYVNADTLRFREDLYVMNADGSNQQRLTESGFPGGYAWKNKEELIQTVTDWDTNLKDVLLRDVETSETTPLMTELDVNNQFWVFWDPVNERLLTINKDHEELPVIIATYELDGKLLHQFRLDSENMRSAIGFDFFIREE